MSIKSSSLAISLFFAMSAGFMSCSNFSEEKSKHEVDYLAVQIHEKESWSIVDSEGNVVVNKEYAAENEISRVYDGGIYWVKDDGGYQLFSIESPKQPIIKEKFIDVTGFCNNRAFVTPPNKPIQMIDSKGKVLKTLPRTIKEVYKFSDKMAMFCDVNGKGGYLNTDGEIAISPAYDIAYNFNDGHSVVTKYDKDSAYCIINKKEQELSRLSSKKYDVVSIMGEGLIALKKKANDNVVFVNKTGEETLKLSDEYSANVLSYFEDGYCVVKSDNKSEYGVINDKGESVIRLGKYDGIANFGKGRFLVSKEKKCGVVDKDDNEIVDVKYDEPVPLIIGGNYIMKDGSYYIFVNKEGQEIKKAEFANVSYDDYWRVEFTDYEAIAEGILKYCKKSGYSELNGKTSVKAIVNLAKIQASEAENYTYTSHITLPSITANGNEVSVTAEFTAFVVESKYHEETVGDGWFSYRRQVYDGVEWSNDAKLSTIDMSINVEEKGLSIFIDNLKAGFKKNGFKEIEDNTFSSGKSNIKYYIYIDDSDNTVTVRSYGY